MNNLDMMLVDAVRNNDLQAVKDLLEAGAGVDARENNDNTALHIAVSNGSREVIKVLIDKGADLLLENKNGGIAVSLALDQKDESLFETILHYVEGKSHQLLRELTSYKYTSSNITLLHHAIELNLSRSAKVLINGVADVNAQDIDKNTPLHLVTFKGNLPLIKALIDRGADLYAENKEYKIPVSLSLIHGSGRTFESFLEYVNPEELKRFVNHKNTKGEALLHQAARINGKSRIVSTLLEKGADVDITNSRKQTSLHLVPESRDVDSARALLDAEANVNAIDRFLLTPIHQAAQKSSPILKLFIERGGDINATTNRGQTPLHFAVSSDNSENVKILVENGANVNIQNQAGELPLELAINKNATQAIEVFTQYKDNKDMTLLHLAAEFGYEKLATLLLGQGSDANAVDNLDNTPLHFSLENDHDEITLTLLENRANVNATNVDSKAPLHIAAQKNKSDIIDLLAEKGAYLDIKNHNTGFAPIHFAVENDHVNATVALIKKGANIDIQNKKGDTPLHLSIEYGHLDPMRVLIGNGASLYIQNTNRDIPIYVAAKKDDTKVVGAFFERLQDKFPVDQELKAELKNFTDYTTLDGKNFLHYAAENNLNSIINAFLDLGVDIESKTITNGTRPLHFAASEDRDGSTIETLLTRRAEVNAQDKKGDTPLHFSAKKGHNEGIDSLINIGNANVNATNTLDQVPLHLAIENEHFNASKILLEHHTDGNAKDNGGNVSLHYAAQGGFYDAVTLLLDHGVDPNPVNKIGEKPLQIAVNSNNNRTILAFTGYKNNLNETLLYLATKDSDEQFVQDLLSAGADVNAQNNNGDAAVHVAAQNGNVDIMHILLDDNKIEPDIKNNLNRTALHYSVQNMSSGTAIELLGAKVDVNNEDDFGNRPLHYAAQSNSFDNAKLLLDHNVEVNAQNSNGDTAMHYAAIGKSEQIYQLLMSRGGNTTIQNNNGVSPDDIYNSQLSNYRSSGILQYHDYTTGLQVLINLLCDKIPPVTLSPVTPPPVTPPPVTPPPVTPPPVDWGKLLHDYIISGNNNLFQCTLDTVKTFMDKHKIINYQDFDGNTLVSLAAKNDRCVIVKVLLDEDVDIRIKNQEGKGPIDLALREKSASSVVIMLRYIVQKFPGELDNLVNSIDSNGMTFLHYSIKYGLMNEAQALLSKNSDVKAITHNGNTVLHILAECGSVDMAEVLLKHITQVLPHKEEREEFLKKKNSNGYSAVDIAYDNDNDCVADLLILDGGGLARARKSKQNGECSRVPQCLPQCDENEQISCSTNDSSEARDFHGIIKDFFHYRFKKFCNSFRTSKGIDQDENTSGTSTMANDRTNQTSRFSRATNYLFGPIYRMFSIDHIDKLAGPSYNSTNNQNQSTTPSVDFSHYNVNSTIMLLDLFIRKVIGNNVGIHLLDHASKEKVEASVDSNTLIIVDKFEKVLKNAAYNSGISVKKLYYNPQELIKVVDRQVKRGDSNGISRILYSAAEKACAGCKQSGRCLTNFHSGLQEASKTIEQEFSIGNRGITTTQAEASNTTAVDRLSEQPSTFISDSSVQNVTRLVMYN